MLARSKLNSIEVKISEALINNEISYEDFVIIINKKKTYRELKESIEWWIVKEAILKKLIWLKRAKKIGINKVIKRNEIINNSLKA